MATSRLLFVVPVLCLENTFSPCPGRWARRGLQKIEDIPPYCTRTLYTGPPGRRRRGSWHILGSLLRSGRGGEGDITRERGTSGRPLWSWFLVSVLLGPRSLPGPTSSPICFPLYSHTCLFPLCPWLTFTGLPVYTTGRPDASAVISANSTTGSLTSAHLYRQRNQGAKAMHAFPLLSCD